jgi:hypothetical protein
MWILYRGVTASISAIIRESAQLTGPGRSWRPGCSRRPGPGRPDCASDCRLGPTLRRRLAGMPAGRTAAWSQPGHSA